MLWKRKSSRDLKILSERDIQSKLYGRHVSSRLDEDTVAHREAMEQLAKEKEGESVKRAQAEGELDKVKEELERAKKELNRANKEKSSLEKKLYKALTDSEAEAHLPQKRPQIRLSKTIFDLSPRVRLIVLSVVALAIAVFASALLISRVRQRPAVSRPKAQALVKEPKETPQPKEINEVKEILPAVVPYTVQICVYEKKVDAENVVTDLKQKGYDAWLTQRTTSKGKIYYNIYVGRFVSDDEATAFLNRVKDKDEFENFKDSFVRRY